MDPLNGLHHKVQTVNSGNNVEKRKKFDSQPVFVKAGLYYHSKYQAVRFQSFYQRFVVSEMLMAKGNDEFVRGKFQEAARNFEQVGNFLPLKVFKIIA